jgi:threonylcarbamoyladenosine tRNA methylthiotransferase MtaB
MPAGPPVAVRTLGCKVNRAESDVIAADLLGRGVRIVGEDEAAIIIVSTCTVTGEADAKARKSVRHALQARRSPIVVVTGCLAAIDAGSLRALGTRVVVEADKDLVVSRVAELLGLPEQPPHLVVRSGPEFRTRAMLKIEDGCDNFCSYCIVPHARGVPRGMPLARAADEARGLVAAGVREIVLTGINLGRYRDPETGADLSHLVTEIARTGIGRLRLSSIEPPDLTPRLLGTLASTPAVCEHLHVPLQSGSDEVLSAMKRKYTVGEYVDRIAEARAAIPGLSVTTDLIAGFPGESDDLHAQTMSLVEHVGFAKLHVFRYSARPGTPAGDMPQIAPAVRASRAADLRELGERLRERYVTTKTGGSAEVLFESSDGRRATGTTRDYLRVHVEGGHEPGSLAMVALGRSDVRVT